jgi:cytochrome c556
MAIWTRVVLGLAAFGLVGAAAPDDGIVSMKATDIIAARRATYYLSGAVFSDLQLGTHPDQPVKDKAFAAGALARWARLLPTMFPVGSGGPPSKADPRVWMDRTGFEARAKDYADAATELARLAQNNDTAGFIAQLPVVRQKCKACHDAYKVKEPTSDGRN